MSQASPRCPECASTDVDRYRDEGYKCNACDHTEFRGEEGDGAAYRAFRARWSDPQPVVTFEELQRGHEELQQSYDKSDREWFWPRERFARVRTRQQRAADLAESADETFTKVLEGTVETGCRFEDMKELPTNQQLFRQIIAKPDDDEPRRAYARWLRGVEHFVAADVADFIDGQLDLAEELRRDPRQDMERLTATLPTDAFCDRTYDGKPVARWWRAMPSPNHQVFCRFTRVLESDGLIDDGFRMRGFFEHVAMRAVRFVELAGEVFNHAPIRHLTLTYCKGHDHDKRNLWKRVLESPYLKQIRSLRIWEHEPGCRDITVLNKLDDTDIEMLAASSNLSGLTYLELRNQTKLTIRAFDALATSKNLPALSFVGHDYFSRTYAIDSPWGGLGGLKSRLSEHALKTHAAELEARHGRIPWLHPVENYGSEMPDLEAVVSHPVALLGR